MKRYILLEDKTIVDTKDGGEYYLSNDKTILSISITIYQDLGSYGKRLGTVKQQSDNLIDLLEVGN